jgi:hypothetical protein
VEEVMTGPDCNKWVMAMDNEVTVLKDMGTYHLIGLLKPRWVFCIIHNKNSDILQHKAQLVHPT